MRTPAELTEAFRARGLKITPQRQCIFRILHGNPEHLTAEAVHARAVAEMPSISLRTVYQTLNDLTVMGEIGSFDLGTGASRFDPNTDPHHHLVCDGCGKVDDVYLDSGAVPVPHPEPHRFTVTSMEVVFRGRCRNCSPLTPTEETTHA